MKKLLIFAAFGLMGSGLMAQTSTAHIDALKKMEFLQGKWQGKAWASMGPGKEYNVDQSEDVQFKLGGEVLLVEGIGRIDGNVAFQAMGIISYDIFKNEYKFKTYKDGGKGMDAYMILKGEKWIEWGFDIPNGGKIKYTIRINEKGQWHEVGEYSPDGQKWFKNFEMTLNKI